MFASNFPIDSLTGSFVRSTEPALPRPNCTLDERRMLFIVDTAVRIYRL